MGPRGWTFGAREAEATGYASDTRGGEAGHEWIEPRRG
jgi:hypothetical protein